MQPDDKMHPQDMRNLILFGVLSIVLWLSYDHFILKPKMEKLRAAQEVAQAAVIEAQTETDTADNIERPRSEIVVDDGRIQIKSDLLFGTINPVGARIDDLSLTNHFKTIERKEHAHVLSPKNSPYPKYIEQGWVSADKNLTLPNNKTRWDIVAGDVLSPDNPVTLRWDNGRGLVFEDVVSLNEDYLFTVIRRVVNNKNAAVTLIPYSIIAQRGMPEDFLGRWIVHEGPIGYFDDELFEETYGKMGKDPQFTETAQKGWVGLTTKDWHTALIPQQGSETKFRVTYTKGALENVKDRYQADMTGQPLVAQAGGMIEFKTQFYAGAKKLSLLKKYEKQLDIPHFDLAVDFGWFYFLTRPFFEIINFFYGFVGNFGVAIILFTIVLRICVFPLANTSFRSFAKMRQIAPQMTELRTTHADDKVKLQQELVKLYQREKVNPMAGCLPILIQIPIFFSLFKVLSNTIEMRHAPFFGWIQDLSAPDPTSVFNLFGLIPWNPPGFLMIGIWPCLMLLTMIFQRKLSPPPSDKLQAQLIAAMPWIMTFVLAQFAAGLVIYWTFNNLLSVIQQYIIMTRMGVKVDIIGNFLGRNAAPADGEVLEGKAEEVTPDEAKEEKPKAVSKPKPKKSKKKK